MTSLEDIAPSKSSNLGNINVGDPPGSQVTFLDSATQPNGLQFASRPDTLRKLPLSLSIIVMLCMTIRCMQSTHPSVQETGATCQELNAHSHTHVLIYADPTPAPSHTRRNTLTHTHIDTHSWSIAHTHFCIKYKHTRINTHTHTHTHTHTYTHFLLLTYARACAWSLILSVTVRVLSCSHENLLTHGNYITHTHTHTHIHTHTHTHSLTHTRTHCLNCLNEILQTWWNLIWDCIFIQHNIIHNGFI